MEISRVSHFVSLVLTISVILLLLEGVQNMGARASPTSCDDSDMQVTQSALGSGRYRVKVSTDCTCGRAFEVVLFCEGLEAGMLADPSLLRIGGGEGGECIVMERQPLTPSTPFTFDYTAPHLLPISLSDVLFDCYQ